MNNDFDKLMERLSPTIRRISHRLNGRFTFFNDDDLCQEALAHLWIMFQEKKLDNKTDSYILQGCYYYLKNYIRTAADKASFSSLDSPVDEEGTMLYEILASHDYSAVDYLETKILRDSAGKIGLSKREMDVINLCAEDLTTREIGKRLGISHVAVVKLRKRIREKCKLLKNEIRIGYQN